MINIPIIDPVYRLNNRYIPMWLIGNEIKLLYHNCVITPNKKVFYLKEKKDDIVYYHAGQETISTQHVVYMDYIMKIPNKQSVSNKLVKQLIKKCKEQIIKYKKLKDDILDIINKIPNNYGKLDHQYHFENNMNTNTKKDKILSFTLSKYNIENYNNRYFIPKPNMIKNINIDNKKEMIRLIDSHICRMKMIKKKYKIMDDPMELKNKYTYDTLLRIINTEIIEIPKKHTHIKAYHIKGYVGGTCLVKKDNILYHTDTYYIYLGKTKIGYYWKSLETKKVSNDMINYLKLQIKNLEELIKEDPVIL